MWLDQQVSLYKCYSDNFGRPASFRDILLTQFAMKHNWWWYDHQTKSMHTGESNDLATIGKLRNEPDEARKKALKNTLQAFTPAALLETKEKNHVKEISRPGVMQLDFDYKDIKDFDVEELSKVCSVCPSSGFVVYHAAAMVSTPWL